MDLSKTNSFKTFNNKETTNTKVHAYEKVINNNFDKETLIPKINFITRRYFETAESFSQRNPLTKNESVDPLHYYLATTRNTYSQRTTTLSERPKTTVGHSKSEMFHVNFKRKDCQTIKAEFAKDNPITDSYVNPHDYMFREFHPPFGRKDFCVS